MRYINYLLTYYVMAPLHVDVWSIFIASLASVLWFVWLDLSQPPLHRTLWFVESSLYPARSLICLQYHCVEWSLCHSLKLNMRPHQPSVELINELWVILSGSLVSEWVELLLLLLLRDGSMSCRWAAVMWYPAALAALSSWSVSRSHTL